MDEFFAENTATYSYILPEFSSGRYHTKNTLHITRLTELDHGQPFCTRNEAAYGLQHSADNLRVWMETGGFADKVGFPYVGTKPLDLTMEYRYEVVKDGTVKELSPQRYREPYAKSPFQFNTFKSFADLFELRKDASRMERLHHRESGLPVCTVAAAARYRHYVDRLFNTLEWYNRWNWSELTPEELNSKVQEMSGFWYLDGLVYAEYYIADPPFSLTTLFNLSQGVYPEGPQLLPAEWLANSPPHDEEAFANHGGAPAPADQSDPASDEETADRA
ncbi:hypothetical protein V5O48_016806 [Marasmius crinis-equi]|uniref:Uncharacterized protein n=1 Tax=Marasmius crinis-equi TaxID=585013 RepID=A0ABR3EQS1_9AGAR